jgi:hypothetical protein
MSVVVQGCRDQMSNSVAGSSNAAIPCLAAPPDVITGADSDDDSELFGLRARVKGWSAYWRASTSMNEVNASDIVTPCKRKLLHRPVVDYEPMVDAKRLHVAKRPKKLATLGADDLVVLFR